MTKEITIEMLEANGIPDSEFCELFGKSWIPTKESCIENASKLNFVSLALLLNEEKLKLFFSSIKDDDEKFEKVNKAAWEAYGEDKNTRNIYDRLLEPAMKYYSESVAIAFYDIWSTVEE